MFKSNTMLKPILISIIYCWSVLATSQHLNISLADRSQVYEATLYSWYPGQDNEPLVTTTIEKGNGQLYFGNLDSGVYSLYLLNDAMANAPWIDVVIDGSGASFQLYWDVSNNWHLFQHSSVNQELSEHKRQYQALTAKLLFLEDLINTNPTHSDGEVLLKELTKEREALLNDINKNQNPWDDYLAILNHYNQEIAINLFWDAFTEADAQLFRTPAIYKVIEKLRKKIWKETKKNKILVEQDLIVNLVQQWGKNEKGLRFLEKWLYSRYNKYETNSLFVTGLEALLTMDSDNAKWKEDYTISGQTVSGKTIDVEHIVEGFIKTENNAEMTLVFFKDSCQSCHHALTQLNGFENQNVIAVSLEKAEVEAKKGLALSYPNIEFVFPKEVEPLKEHYAYRGTPAIYHLKKTDNIWKLN